MASLTTSNVNVMSPKTIWTGIQPNSSSELGYIADERLKQQLRRSTDTNMTDQELRDHLERLIMSTEAPTPSMLSAASHVVGNEAALKRVALRDCRWWVREVVGKLVEEQLLPPDPQKILSSVGKG